jgi:hypothetical protein
VERGGPELIELLVALDAAPGAGIALEEVHPVGFFFRKVRGIFLFCLNPDSQDQEYDEKKDF